MFFFNFTSVKLKKNILGILSGTAYTHFLLQTKWSIHFYNSGKKWSFPNVIAIFFLEMKAFMLQLWCLLIEGFMVIKKLFFDGCILKMAFTSIHPPTHPLIHPGKWFLIILSSFYLFLILFWNWSQMVINFV